MTTLANVLFALKEGVFGELTAGTEHNLAGGFIGIGTAVPDNGATGWQPAAIFMHSDLTNQTNAFYCNIGSVTSANFNLVTVAAG